MLTDGPDQERKTSFFQNGRVSQQKQSDDVGLNSGETKSRISHIKCHIICINLYSSQLMGNKINISNLNANKNVLSGTKANQKSTLYSWSLFNAPPFSRTARGRKTTWVSYWLWAAPWAVHPELLSPGVAVAFLTVLAVVQYLAAFHVLATFPSFSPSSHFLTHLFLFWVTSLFNIITL